MSPIRSMLTLLAVAQTVAIAQTDTTLHASMYTVKTYKTTYAVGAPVKISFAIDNRSTEPLVYRFPSGQQFDMWASKDGTEVWRWSRGRMFIQAFTTLTVPPRDQKVFTETWNQTDADGKQVPEGRYNIFAQIKGQATTIARTTISIGTVRVAATSTTTKIASITRNTANYLGKTVTVSGTYRGWRPGSNSPACKQGPPVSRSDWAIADASGCIYVHGKSSLDPTGDIGKAITVTGIVKKTSKGQPYIQSTEVDAN